MKKYICIKDYQGGEFGMYRCFTAKQWGKQAFEWADMDDWENPKECLIENFKTEEGLIDFIQDIWDIKIVALTKKNKELLDYLKQIKKIYNFSSYEHKWANTILENIEKGVYDNDKK